MVGPTMLECVDEFDIRGAAFDGHIVARFIDENDGGFSRGTTSRIIKFPRNF